MSFWESELGEITGNPEDAFTKTFTTIPDGTRALAVIEKAYIKVGKFRTVCFEWNLIDGDFKKRRVFQDLPIFLGENADEKAKYAHYKALNMFKFMYRFFGIGLNHVEEPHDTSLAFFIGKKAGIVITEKQNKDGKIYNNVGEVHKPDGFVCETGIKIVINKTPANNPHHQDNYNLYDSAFSRNNSNALEADVPF